MPFTWVRKFGKIDPLRSISVHFFPICALLVGWGGASDRRVVPPSDRPWLQRFFNFFLSQRNEHINLLFQFELDIHMALNLQTINSFIKDCWALLIKNLSYGQNCSFVR